MPGSLRGNGWMIPGIVKDSGLGCQPDTAPPGFVGREGALQNPRLLPNFRVGVRHCRLRRFAPGRAARLGGGNVRNRRRLL